jgi:hypothetical protein
LEEFAIQLDPEPRAYHLLGEYELERELNLSPERVRALLERFVLGVPVYRQRFRPLASVPTTEQFYRLIRVQGVIPRACLAFPRCYRGQGLPHVHVTDTRADAVAGRHCGHGQPRVAQGAGHA